jgi:hypothetical protein
MSLINDALKKAQSRHGDSTPPAAETAGPASIPPGPRKGKSPLGKIGLIGAGIALLSAAVSAAVILLVIRKEPRAPSPIGRPETAQAHPPISPAPTSPTPTKPAKTPSALSPVTPGAASSAQPALNIAAPVTPASPAVLPPEPAPAIKLGTRIQSFIDRLRVTSIRISDTGNKAILNDRLFRVNDLVEPSLGLRLTDIQPSLLTFTDEAGTTYLRHF